MQRLTMPFKSQTMLCGYKNKEYFRIWTYNHFGVDISSIYGGAGSDPTVYASGDGTVVAAGYDYGVGGALVIIYPDCYIHKTGAIKSIAARYMHMQSLAVKPGDKVKRGDRLGIEGKEKTRDYHLHLEFDRDTDFPCLSPQVKGANIIKGGLDTTVNPSYLLYVGEGQRIVKPTYNLALLQAEDFTIPAYSEPTKIEVYAEEIDALNLKCREQGDELGRLMDERNAALEKIAKIAKIIG